MNTFHLYSPLRTPIRLGLVGLVSFVLLNTSAFALPANSNNNETNPAEYYANFYDQAMEAYNKGDSTQAIELLTKAFRLAPTNTAILNNLAAAYIQRGVGFHNKNKNYAMAADDYRRALFYLEYMWPNGLQKTQSNLANVDIARDNLLNSIKGLKANVNDAKWHLQAASDLQRKGNLQGALVEYSWVTRLSPNTTEAWVRQGDLLGVFQRWDRALGAYQKALETNPTAKDSLYVKLGTAYLQTQNSPKAVDAFNKALAISSKQRDALLGLEQVWRKEISLNPKNLSAHINLGAVYQQLERYQDAQGMYAKAQQIDPNNPLIPLNLGSLLISQHQYDRALGYLDQVLKADPNNSKALAYKAEALKQLGRTQEASQALEKVATTAPNMLNNNGDPHAAFEERVSLAQGNPQKIHDVWSEYAKAFPNEADVQYRAGLALHEQKDYAGAVSYYQKAASLESKRADIYANLGSALSSLNKATDAISALKKAVALDPKLDSAKQLLASLEKGESSNALVKAAQLHDKGQYVEAATLYQQALKADPNNADVYSRLGLAWQALKKYPDAERAYEKAIALDGNNALYWYYRGTLYSQQGQVDQAKTQFEKALALDANFTQAKEALDSVSASASQADLVKAYEAYEKKQYPQALTQIDKLLKLDPNNAMAYYYRGLIFDAQQKADPAKQAYTKAIEINPQFSDAHYALAVVYDTQGDGAKAKEHYQAFVNLSQNQQEDEFIRYAKERLNAL